MINVDESPINQDWTKAARGKIAWDLPPYKSNRFYNGLFTSLATFRKLPVYKQAVKSGLIKNDEWVGQ